MQFIPRLVIIVALATLSVVAPINATIAQSVVHLPLIFRPFPPQQLAYERPVTQSSGLSVNELYLTDEYGAFHQRITHSPENTTSQDPNWSPDGSKLLFVRRTAFTQIFQIYVINADGTGEKNLTPNIQNAWSPHWSPDGNRIIFLVNNNGANDIFVMDAGGNNQTLLASGAGDPFFDPAFSADGSKILFLRGSILGLMNADGSNQTTFPHNSPWGEYRPAWSPTDNRIVVSRGEQEVSNGEQGQVFQSDLYVMNEDGSNLTRLTQTADAYESTPAWSPDGTKIVFWRTDLSGSAGGSIHVINADGSGEFLLSASGGIGPVWSADGRKIAWVHHKPSNPAEIVIVNPDGGGEVRLVMDHSVGNIIWRP